MIFHKILWNMSGLTPIEPIIFNGFTMDLLPCKTPPSYCQTYVVLPNKYTPLPPS